MSLTKAASPEAYAANIRAWLGDFGFERPYAENLVVFLHLVHGASLLHVDSAFLAGYKSEKFVQGCDGAFTSLQGAKRVVLTVKTADCLPVFLFDPKTKASALLHCGWRGTRDCLLPKCIRRLALERGVKASELLICFGPRIGRENYAVGKEFAGMFPRSVAKDGNRLLFDLAGENRLQALDCGAAAGNIADSGLCTYANAKDFFSFRREGLSGTMISFISVL